MLLLQFVIFFRVLGESCTISPLEKALSLQLNYRDIFTHYLTFMQENINLQNNSWIRDLSDIFDNNVLEDIRIDIDRNNVSKVVQNLIRLNDVDKYIMFLNIWLKHDPAKANQFIQKLLEKIHNQGLL